MALFFGELASKPLDKNGLRNHMDVKKDDQRDETKNNIDHVDAEDGLGAATGCRETKSDDSEGQEENNKNRVAPDPPIALLNSPKFARQFLVSGLYRSCDGVNAGVTHGVEGGVRLPQLTKLVCPGVGVKSVPISDYKLVTRRRNCSLERRVKALDH